MLEKFAEDLKNQRESLGISLMDIADETRLHHSIFEKMEKGDFDFQPPTYIKAFLKQYAKIIRLDPDDVLRDYDLARAGKYTPKALSKPQPDILSGADTSEKLTRPSNIEGLEDVFETTSPAPPKTEFSEHPKKKSSEQGESSAPKRIQVEKESFIEPPEGKRPNFSAALSDKKNYPKYVGITILVILVIAGLFFIAKTLFFDKGTPSTQNLIRNKIDTISTASDIQKIDSIKSAKEKDATTGEYKFTLKITAKKDGARLQVATDGKITDETEVVSLKNGQEREWRANEYFTIRSKNTNDIKATINDKNIKFKLADTQRLKVYLSDDGKVQTE